MEDDMAQPAQTVTIEPVEADVDLFELDPNDPPHGLWPCVVELDLRSGTLRAGAKHALPGGGHSPEEHYGIVRSWLIEPASADWTNALLAQLEPLAQRVLDGAELHWNGNNTIAHLDEDAQAADADIYTACAEHASDLTSYNARDWLEFSHADIGRQLLAGETIAAIAAEHRRIAEDNHNIILGDLEWEIERIGPTGAIRSYGIYVLNGERLTVCALDDGGLALYTDAEWQADADADLEADHAGRITFQGKATGQTIADLRDTFTSRER
jgi:hypothetical protein